MLLNTPKGGRVGGHPATLALLENGLVIRLPVPFAKSLTKGSLTLIAQKGRVGKGRVDSDNFSHQRNMVERVTMVENV